MVALNFLTIAGIIITRTRDVRIGGNFRLQGVKRGECLIVGCFYVTMRLMALCGKKLLRKFVLHLNLQHFSRYEN
jgi:hypothetical protein